MFHAPAPYSGSSRSLISASLGHPPSALLHPHCISVLAEAAAKPEWSSLHDIDISLHQLALSRAIDEASFDALLISSPDIRSRALVLSCAILHAGDWLNSSAFGLIPLNINFTCPCTTG